MPPDPQPSIVGVFGVHALIGELFLLYSSLSADSPDKFLVQLVRQHCIDFCVTLTMP